MSAISRSMLLLKHRLIWWARFKLWPVYDCEQCVGQETQHGYYCAYQDSYSLCDMAHPPWWVNPSRKLFTKLTGLKN